MVAPEPLEAPLTENEQLPPTATATRVPVPPLSGGGGLVAVLVGLGAVLVDVGLAVGLAEGT